MSTTEKTNLIPKKSEFKRRLNGKNRTEDVVVWLTQFGAYSNHFYLLVNPNSRNTSSDLIIGPEWAVAESGGLVVSVVHAINLVEEQGISEVWAIP